MEIRENWQSLFAAKRRCRLHTRIINIIRNIKFLKFECVWCEIEREREREREREGERERERDKEREIKREIQYFPPKRTHNFIHLWIGRTQLVVCIHTREPPATSGQAHTRKVTCDRCGAQRINTALVWRGARQHIHTLNRDLEVGDRESEGEREG